MTITGHGPFPSSGVKRSARISSRGFSLGNSTARFIVRISLVKDVSWARPPAPGRAGPASGLAQRPTSVKRPPERPGRVDDPAAHHRQPGLDAADLLHP